MLLEVKCMSSSRRKTERDFHKDKKKKTSTKLDKILKTGQSRQNNRHTHKHAVFSCPLRFPFHELLTLINKGLAWTVVITFSLSLLHREQCQRHKTERRTSRGHESLYINTHTHTGHWCAILTNTLEARQNDEKPGYMTWWRHFSTFEVCGCVSFSFYPTSYSVTIFFLLAWAV